MNLAPYIESTNNYVQIPLIDARDLGYPAPDWWEDGWEDEGQQEHLEAGLGIWFVGNPDLPIFIACDGGLFRDAGLGDDYEWVIHELNRAFESGLLVGMLSLARNSKGV